MQEKIEKLEYELLERCSPKKEVKEEIHLRHVKWKQKNRSGEVPVIVDIVTMKEEN